MGILSDELGVERVIYSEETIKKRITELGEQIAKDYAGQELIVIGLIRGAMYFLADLTRAIDLPIKVDMIGFTNIPDTTSKTGVVRIIKDIELDIAGKNVLVVEDIIRTGLTTAYIIQNLEMKRPKEIRLCSMLVNPDRLLIPNSYVTLLADLQNPPSYPSVPQSAIVDMPGGGVGVWVVKDDGTVERRAVKTRDAYLGWCPMLEGLKEGERVVISGVAKLQPGMKVVEVSPTPNEDITPGFKPTVED